MAPLLSPTQVFLLVWFVQRAGLRESYPDLVTNQESHGKIPVIVCAMGGTNSSLAGSDFSLKAQPRQVLRVLKSEWLTVGVCAGVMRGMGLCMLPCELTQSSLGMRVLWKAAESIATQHSGSMLLLFQRAGSR